MDAEADRHATTTDLVARALDSAMRSVVDRHAIRVAATEESTERRIVRHVVLMDLETDLRARLVATTAKIVRKECRASTAMRHFVRKTALLNG